MNILFDINHPAHVHFFKNLYWKLKEENHNITVIASKKDITFTLLNNYNIPFINIGSYGKSMLSKLVNLLLLDIKMFFILLKYKPDYVLGINTIRGAHAGIFFKKTKVYIFTDTEHAKEQILLYKYIVNKIFTPKSFVGNLGKNHIKYDGFHDLAYLHPNYFQPNKNILNKFGIKPNDEYYIIRFISWNATHDVGQQGLTDQEKIKLVKFLEKHGKVLITSEGKLPPVLEKNRIKTSPEDIHHLLYFAKIYIGEGGTMATESAVLGTPSLLINNLEAGVFNEIEQNYDLLKKVSTFSQALPIIKKWTASTNLKSIWSKRRRKMLEEKIDVTDYIYKNL